MKENIAHRLERAVKALCPEVKARSDALESRLCEEELRKELTLCILSSQVPYELASAATVTIDQAGLLADPIWLSDDGKFLKNLSVILEKPLFMCGKYRRYRFPNSRAHQLNNTRRTLHELNIRLEEIVYASTSPVERRRHLENIVSGFGPKQASMFLRNSYATVELAILDTHVLKYMRLIRLIQRSTPLLNRRLYELFENRFRTYANQLGYSPGYVDWAIWFVMRAAREDSAL